MITKKICKSCGKEKNVKFFHLKKKSNKKIYLSYCKECINKRTLEYSRNLKKEAVDYKGGKCNKCGYNKCLAALQFHHLNPKEKDFIISNKLTTSFKKIKNELDKCMLVCANCHFEIHNENYKYKPQNKKSKFVKVQKENIELLEKDTNWKDPNILKELVWKYPSVRLAKHFNTTEGTILKKCRENNIEKPPPGYWSSYKIM